jgi:hypothetical protein
VTSFGEEIFHQPNEGKICGIVSEMNCANRHDSPLFVHVMHSVEGRNTPLAIMFTTKNPKQIKSKSMIT